MERQYKAFISYRHLPLDAKVAKMLHKRIEHFIVPGDLRKNCGKKLGYVFRDQEEMPLSSNLQMNIETALDHSEYLIVICSPKTKESKWVLREIEYFLLNHDRSHLLAVLADGTPGDSFPPQLLQDVSADGKTVELIEPLAANVVSSSDRKRKRLFRTESLRILSALIPCKYDELYKREQRYRTRRILTAITAALCVAGVFIGMLLAKNREVRENYDLAVRNYEQSVKNYNQSVENYDLAMSNLNQALRNQSSYLSSESLKLLEEGDKLGAIALAVEALPQEGKERPYVSKAEYALGCAVNAYLSPGMADSFVTTGVLQHASTVRDFLVHDDGNIVCSLDDASELICWDTKSYSKRWTRVLTGSSMEWKLVGFIGEKAVLIQNFSELLCLDLQSGESLWQCDKNELSADGKEISTVSSVRLAPNGRIVLFAEFLDDSFVFRGVVYRLDSETGALENSVAWPELHENVNAPTVQAYDAVVSDDGTLAASEFDYFDQENEKKQGIAVISLESGELLYSVGNIPEETYITSIMLADHDKLLYSTWDSLENFGSMSIGGFSVLGHDKGMLHCVDINKGILSWSYEYECSLPGGNESSFFDPNLADVPVIVFSYANHVDVLNAENGELLANTEFPSPIANVGRINKVIGCITDAGQLGVIDPSDFSKWNYENIFKSTVMHSSMAPGSWWIHTTGSNTVIHYEQEKADNSWIPAELSALPDKSDNFFSERTSYVSDDCVAMLYHDVLRISKGDSPDTVEEYRIDELKNTYDSDILGCYDGVLYIFYDSFSAGAGVVACDTASQSYSVHEDQIIKFVCRNSSDDGWFVICVEPSGDEEFPVEWYACRLDNDFSVKDQKTLGIRSANRYETIDAVPMGSKCYVGFTFDPDEPKFIAIDSESLEVEDCPETIRSAFECSMLSDSDDLELWYAEDVSLIAAEKAAGELHVLDAEGKELGIIRTEMTDTLSAAFSPDGTTLMTIENDFCLHRYDIQKGNLLGRTDLYYTAYLAGNDSIRWQYPDGDYFLVYLEDCVNLISTEDYGVFAYVPYCLGYREKSDSFFCYTYDGSDHVYGSFPRHSTEWLIAYGKERLNGWELDGAQRIAYGLD